ncbi:MAG: hypothetical protein NT077_01010 [Candidatus Taylorbacteria bacterium]|nr:hypothetical protein [Candidatus Taylorbacteria bacterium]
MENSFEKGSERIPTKEEVMEVVFRFDANAVFVGELSDERGIYLLEAESRDEQGDRVEYVYQRKGTFPDQNSSLETVIHVVYYDGEVPVGGKNIATYKSETGEWESV